MADLLYFALVGLGSGGLYALMGAGIVVAHRGSGVINFAHGAMAVYSAYVFAELNRSGVLILPWVDFLPEVAGRDLNVPVHITISSQGLGIIPSFIGMMGMAVLLGVLAHVLVFRPLRNAPPLGKVIGAIGILIYLQAVASFHFGRRSATMPTVLPSGQWENFLGTGRTFPIDRLSMAVAALVVALLVAALFRWTRFGLATRAAAGNEKGAVLLGYSPDRLAIANWVLASVLAALAAFLAGPISGTLEPGRFTLFLVPALGAALIGGLRSVVVASLGGIALGFAENMVLFFRQQPWFPDWPPTDGIQVIVPFLVLTAVLFLRGSSLPMRGNVEEARLPRAPLPRNVLPHALGWSALAFLLGWVLVGPWAFAFTTTLILTIFMLSYVVLTGYVGQISLAQLALAGTAAFLMIRLMGDGGLGLPLLVAVPLAVTAAVVVGLLIGLPALRIRGVQLAVITIAAAITIENFYFRNAALTGVTLGQAAPVPEPTLLGMDLGVVGPTGLSDSPVFTAFCVVVLTLCAVAVANLRRSLTGRRLLAVRGNERAAASVGIDVARTKLVAAGVSAALAGVSGCLLAFQQQSISSANWVFFFGLVLLAYAYLGGITSVAGAVVGGILAPAGLLAFFGRYHLTGIEQYMQMIGAVGLIVTAIVHPSGIAPFFAPQLRALGEALVRYRTAEWKAAVRRLGPTILVGGAIGWLLWTRQPDHTWWMTLLGIGLALAVRGAAVVPLLARRREKEAASAPAADRHSSDERTKVGS